MFFFNSAYALWDFFEVQQKKTKRFKKIMNIKEIDLNLLNSEEVKQPQETHQEQLRQFLQFQQQQLLLLQQHHQQQQQQLQQQQQIQYQQFLQQLQSQTMPPPPPPPTQLPPNQETSICVKLNALLSDRSLFATRKNETVSAESIFTFLHIGRNSMQKLTLELNQDESNKYIAGNSKDMVQISDSTRNGTEDITVMLPLEHTCKISNGIVKLKIDVKTVYECIRKRNMDRSNMHEFHFCLFSEDSLPFTCVSGVGGSKMVGTTRVCGWVLPKKMQLKKKRKSADKNVVFNKDGVKFVRVKQIPVKDDRVVVKKRKLQ